MTTNLPTKGRGSGIETAGRLAISAAPVLITAQEVAFGTAAARALPRTNHVWPWTAALRRVFTIPAAGQGPAAPRHYPPRDRLYLDQAAMGRAMYRL
jgi:hypothetical protein